MNWHEIYVVVIIIIFLPQVIFFPFVFGCGKVMYANEVETKEKQKLKKYLLHMRIVWKICIFCRK